MKIAVITKAVLCSGILLTASIGEMHADEIPTEYRNCVEKGLEYLASQQANDGHWDANGGDYPEAMTALSGLTMLMQGSTLREGKYAARLRKAVDWLILRSQPSGLIANPTLSGSYMYGHGFAMLFLSSVYGEETDRDLRRKLEDLLTRAVLFSGQAQDRRGAWHYVSARDGGDGDSSSTVTQMQGLRAARNAGIVVPKEIIDKGIDCLRQTTGSDGGVAYKWGAIDGGRPALTAAALASSFSAGEYSSDLVKKWIRYCERNIPPLSVGDRLGHDEYTHCYLAQSIYNLGDDRYAKLFPESPPERRLTWSKYRKAVYDSLMPSQSANGSWSNAGIGAVYATAMHLIVLQLDNAALPIFQR